MNRVLHLLGMITAGLGIYLLKAEGPTNLQDIQAYILFVVSAIFISSGCIVNAIQDVGRRIASLEELDDEEAELR